jgi:hypothetical protein
MSFCAAYEASESVAQNSENQNSENSVPYPSSSLASDF